MLKLNRLPQDIINQIAAGEVIERPASIVKELVDNSIDAGATEIIVKIIDGGIKSIEVTDNGTGIEKENLSQVFLPHTTSKLSKIEDLNTISTMGFRGEALSTILSVSHVIIRSKADLSDNGYELDFKKDNKVPIKSSKEKGTTIIVSDLFFNTPARLKFLKTSDTEYRKIYDVFLKYAICYPNIKFSLFKENKLVINLFNTTTDVISKERVKELLKKEYVTKMIDIYSKGDGVEITGIIAHPSDISIKSADQYIFVNNRPIWDNGLSRAVHQGYSRYIPHGMKVPYILKININPNLIDVNVHPRKEEIRFLNPFRVYMAIENAVTQSLKTFAKNEIGADTPSNHIDSDINSQSNLFDRSNTRYSANSQIKEMRFDKKPSDFDIRRSLNFTKELFKTTDSEINTNIQDFKQVLQIFNKYIVVEFQTDIWIIDQHAAAERINFEKLLKQQNISNKDIQVLLLPTTLELNETEILIVKENMSFFEKLGFGINVKKDKIEINSIPAFIEVSKIEEIFKSLDEDTDINKDIEKLQEDIIATIACHGSVRAGQTLSTPECVSLFNQLKECENPFSCPHGRPAIWKLKLTEIDTKFLRTY